MVSITKLSHKGKVDNLGKFKPDNIDFFKFDFESYRGQRVSVSVSEAKETRTIDQNAYYWSVVIRSVMDAFNRDHTFNRNMTPYATHEFLKAKHLGFHRVEFKGEIIDVPNSSAKLNKKGFSDYIDNIRAFAAEYFKINIPEATKK